MFERFTKKFYLTRGEKAYLLGYLVVILVAPIVALVVMAGLAAPYTLVIEPTNFVYWVAISGAISAGVGLYLARGWMGNLGMMGIARAMVGIVIATLIAAVVAGSLTVPFEGTLYAPLMMLSAFIAKPWLAAIWLAATFGAHYLMSIVEEERAFGIGREAHRSATSQLSTLSRAQLYHRD
ncbi:hypothetical protein [Roseobacter sp. CCS2]|uniref:hypothetical protein n=1 Tax=Roseobacter sp. CCS2 TaxID=391593 RepID=UPI0000F3E467|nr:hypothetical protein [Roseobacter sp. CCS2]EBA12822.1 hypothetical protein RCCS2_16034 [Roseobacter sp. CCS2]